VQLTDSQPELGQWAVMKSLPKGKSPKLHSYTYNTFSGVASRP